jgi:hypothetical protein
MIPDSGHLQWLDDAIRIAEATCASSPPGGEGCPARGGAWVSGALANVDEETMEVGG